MKSDPPGVRVFGHLADGTPVHAITLQAPSGLCAQVLAYGGILRRLQVPTRGSLVDVVLGLPDLGAYLNDRHHLGTLVGRFGNRIKHARFVLDGREYQLDRNDGAHHLHGGAQGFGRRIWTLDECSPAHAVLGYQSPAGEQGYPGRLTVSARFELHDDGLELSSRAHTDNCMVGRGLRPEFPDYVLSPSISQIPRTNPISRAPSCTRARTISTASITNSPSWRQVVIGKARLRACIQAPGQDA